jgi:hypothetical protein
MDISKSYDNIRMTSRLEINSTNNDISIRPEYQHLPSAAANNNDKTLSGGDTNNNYY